MRECGARGFRQASCGRGSQFTGMHAEWHVSFASMQSVVDLGVSGHVDAEASLVQDGMNLMRFLRLKWLDLLVEGSAESGDVVCVESKGEKHTAPPKSASCIPASVR